jgi:hypothetical protein
MGYFYGIPGRSRVSALLHPGVEKPSDGVHTECGHCAPATGTVHPLTCTNAQLAGCAVPDLTPPQAKTRARVKSKVKVKRGENPVKTEQRPAQA